MPQISLITFRQGYASDWTATNPVLELGEPGYVLDTGQLKVGNGAQGWNDLVYVTGSPGPAGVWTQITQAAYNALVTPDPAVLYLIVG